MSSAEIPSDVWSPMPPPVDCAVCGEPIMWCLDMFSYTCENPHRLAHARCAWRPEAFDRQKRLASGDSLRARERAMRESS